MGHWATSAELIRFLKDFFKNLIPRGPKYQYEGSMLKGRACHDMPAGPNYVYVLWRYFETLWNQKSDFEIPLWYFEMPPLHFEILCGIPLPFVFLLQPVAMQCGAFRNGLLAVFMLWPLRLVIFMSSNFARASGSLDPKQLKTKKHFSS